MSRIIGKPIKKGDRCEAKWLQDSIADDFKEGYSWFDPITKTFSDQIPERLLTKKFGQAPVFMSDVMEPYYHPAAQKVVESRSELKELDEKFNTITTDKKLPPDPTKKRLAAKARKEHNMQALKDAVEMVEAGTAPLTDEFKQLCQKRNEMISKQLGIDAQNIVGRKNK